MVIYVCNLSTWETEARDCYEFKVSLGCITGSKLGRPVRLGEKMTYYICSGTVRWGEVETGDF